MTRSRASRLDGFGYSGWRLSPAATAVYLWIAEHPGCTLREVALAVGRPTTYVGGLVEQLLDSEHVLDERGRLFRRGPS